jgi:hypothetical protein
MREGITMTSTGKVSLAIAFALVLFTDRVVVAQSSILATIPDATEPSALRSVPAETTAAAVADREWRVPRTSWGDPVIEGVWSTDDMRSVPMTRAAELGTRESLTEEEFYDRASRDQGAHDDPENASSFLQHEYGIRTFGYASMIIDPPDGQMPPLTRAGEAINASRTRGTYSAGPFNSFEDFSLYDRCITRGPIGSVLPAIYGNGVQIVQGPATVAITSEMIHETRIVHLEQIAPLDDGIRQFSGSARGYWDGDTLVVESGGYTDRASVSRVPNSLQFRLTERFTRVDPEMVEYVATIEDPVTLTAPFTFRLMLTTQPAYAVYEYNCHEGNQVVRNALSGERVYEKQVAEALAKGLPIPARATEHTQIRNGHPDVLFNINAGE